MDLLGYICKIEIRACLKKMQMKRGDSMYIYSFVAPI